MEKSISNFDSNGYEYRKLYFLRNMFRTLMEIHGAIQTLTKDNRFQKEILKQPKPFRDAFKRLSKELSDARPLFKDLRNSIGGHVLQKSVSESLKNIDPSRSGFFEINVDRKNIHCKFASELCMSIMFDDVPAEKQKDKAEKIISKIKKAIPISAIDAVLTTYIETRALLR